VHELTGIREPGTTGAAPFDDTVERHASNRSVGASAVGLAITGAVELVIALVTGSVGLLGDALHNLPDVSPASPSPRVSAESTGVLGALPLWLGAGRRLAGLGVALVIWASAEFAGIESVRKPLSEWWTSGGRAEAGSAIKFAEAFSLEGPFASACVFVELEC
jgi:hypothetical protein